MKKRLSQTFLANIYEKLDNIKLSKRPKVSSEEFQIPSVFNYSHIIYFNYNVSQLRSISRFYKQKISGNKKQLVYRLYNFLKLSKHIIKIQALYRGYLRRLYNRLQGPAWRDRECVNTTDFLSLKTVTNIPYHQFFSYTCIDGQIYGFNIMSLYNLIKKNKVRKNPYNRLIIEEYTIKDVFLLIKIAKILNEPMIISIKNETANLSLEKKIQLKTLSLFQKLDSLGHTTDTRWISNLSRIKLIRWIKELRDIWNYRSELVNSKKRSICPPNGDPFIGINISSLGDANIMTLRRTCLCIMENLIMRSSNSDDQALGAFYVLGALTIVSIDAANSLPWLFESFNPNNVVQT